MQKHCTRHNDAPRDRLTIAAFLAFILAAGFAAGTSDYEEAVRAETAERAHHHAEIAQRAQANAAAMQALGDTATPTSR